MKKRLPGLARKLLQEAMQRLRSQAWAMGEAEIRQNPAVRGDLRLSDRIERYLAKQ